MQLQHICTNKQGNPNWYAEEVKPGNFYTPQRLWKTNDDKNKPTFKFLPCTVTLPQVPGIASPLEEHPFQRIRSTPYYQYLTALLEIYFLLSQVFRLGRYFAAAIRSVEVNLTSLTGAAWYDASSKGFHRCNLDFFSINTNLFRLFRSLTLLQQGCRVHYQLYLDFLNQALAEELEHALPPSPPSSTSTPSDSDSGDDDIMSIKRGKRKSIQNFAELMKQMQSFENQIKQFQKQNNNSSKLVKHKHV